MFKTVTLARIDAALQNVAAKNARVAARRQPDYQ